MYHYLLNTDETNNIIPFNVKYSHIYTQKFKIVTILILHHNYKKIFNT